jgi:hypothetical protein
LSTHLHLGLPTSLFTFGFATNILYVFLFSPFEKQNGNYDAPLCRLWHSGQPVMVTTEGNKMLIAGELYFSFKTRSHCCECGIRYWSIYPCCECQGMENSGHMAHFLVHDLQTLKSSAEILWMYHNQANPPPPPFSN